MGRARHGVPRVAHSAASRHKAACPPRPHSITAPPTRQQAVPPERQRNTRCRSRPRNRRTGRLHPALRHRAPQSRLEMPDRRQPQRAAKSPAGSPHKRRSRQSMTGCESAAFGRTLRRAHHRVHHREPPNTCRAPQSLAGKELVTINGASRRAGTPVIRKETGVPGLQRIVSQRKSGLPDFRHVFGMRKSDESDLRCCARDTSLKARNHFRP
ncbi:MAG: hypothetical protein OJF62_003252 [Pseudolabrys sp.]|nr:hypothetical protein [Pseudolabrys sp.]